MSRSSSEESFDTSASGDGLVELVDDGAEATERREANAAPEASKTPATQVAPAPITKSAPAPQAGRHHCKTLASPISAMLAESMGLAREPETFQPVTPSPDAARPFEGSIRQIQITEDRVGNAVQATTRNAPPRRNGG